MPKDSPTYLALCHEQFAAVTTARWGKAFTLGRIEKDVEKLLHRKSLTYDDLAYFSNHEHWWFKQWWLLPPKADVNEVLKDQSFAFWQLSKKNEGKAKEIDIIKQLFAAFKSIELTSIVLRFLRPDSYGILSPPTERMLDLRRGHDAVETYLNYLDNIRRIRDAPYGLDRAADVDMALWVLHARCFEPSLKDHRIQRDFERDPFMLRLRAENLFSSLSNVPLPFLAQAVQKIHGHLAALVGAHFFELEVRRHARLKGTVSWESLSLDQLIDALAKTHTIDPLTQGRWHHLRLIRNAVIHTGKVPSIGQLDELIREALEIERTNQALQDAPVRATPFSKRVERDSD